MRKFTDAVNENETLKTYKYTATIKTEGLVEAHDEGEAGELADKEMDVASGLINVASYTIDNIEVTDQPIQEDHLNEAINIQPIFNVIMDKITSEMNVLGKEEQVKLAKALIENLESIINA